MKPSMSEDGCVAGPILCPKILTVLPVFLGFLGLLCPLHVVFIVFSIASLIASGLLEFGMRTSYSYRALFVNIALCISALVLLLFSEHFYPGNERFRAKLKGDINSLREIYHACMQYADDNDGAIPPSIPMLNEMGLLPAETTRSHFIDKANGFRIAVEGYGNEIAPGEVIVERIFDPISGTMTMIDLEGKVHVLIEWTKDGREFDDRCRAVNEAMK